MLRHEVWTVSRTRHWFCIDLADLTLILLCELRQTNYIGHKRNTPCTLKHKKNQDWVVVACSTAWCVRPFLPFRESGRSSYHKQSCYCFLPLRIDCSSLCTWKTLRLFSFPALLGVFQAPTSKVDLVGIRKFSGETNLGTQKRTSGQTSQNKITTKQHQVFRITMVCCCKCKQACHSLWILCRLVSVLSAPVSQCRVRVLKRPHPDPIQQAQQSTPLRKVKNHCDQLKWNRKWSRNI